MSRVLGRRSILPGSLLGLGLLLVGVVLVSRSTGVLMVVDVKGERVLLRERVVPGDEFVVEYTHSSEKVPVSTRFAVTSGWQISPTETAFASFGPGLPELLAGDAYEVSQGMMRLRHDGDRLCELSFFVHPFTDHRLRVKGQTIELSRRVAAGGLVKVRVEPRGLLQVLREAVRSALSSGGRAGGRR